MADPGGSVPDIEPRDLDLIEDEMMQVINQRRGRVSSMNDFQQRMWVLFEELWNTLNPPVVTED